MKSISEEPTIHRRPGGRTAEVSERIRRAALELLLEGGPEHCTFASVAERAAVERSTLYRRYEDRWMMIMDAISGAASDHVSSSEGSFARDLKAVLVRGAETMSGPLGPVVLALAAALRGTPREFHIQRYWARRMEQLRPMFDAAIARGELAADVDREELFAFAMGTIHVRNFVAAKPVDEAWINRIVEFVCERYCVRPRGRKRSVEVKPPIAAAEEE